MAVIHSYFFSLIILLTFSSFVLTQKRDLWEVHLVQDDPKQEHIIELPLGIYTAAKLLFIPPETPSEIKELKGKIKLDTYEYHFLNSGPDGIDIDTSISKEMKVYLGRHCSKGNIEDIEVTLDLKFDHEDDKVPINYASSTLSLSIVKNMLNLKQTQDKISFEQKGKFSIENSFKNVDDIIISFNGDKYTSQHSYASKYTVPKSVTGQEQGGEQDFGIIRFDYIIDEQRLYGVTNQEECFALDKPITFSMNADDVKEITPKLHQHLKEKVYLVEDITKGYFALTVPKEVTAMPLMIHCAAFNHFIKDISNDDVIKHNSGSHAAHELQFSSAAYNDNNIDLLVKFQGVLKYSLLRMKCLFIANPDLIPQPKNFLSTSLTIGSYPEADKQSSVNSLKFTATNCGTWHFERHFTLQKAFNDAVRAYAKKTILPEPSDDASCFTFDDRSPNDLTSIICLIPKESCVMQNARYYHYQFATLKSKLSTTEDINKNLLIEDKDMVLSEIFHESDYQSFNYSEISSTILTPKEDQTDKYEIRLNLLTKGPSALCYFRKIDKVNKWDFTEEEFYDDSLKIELRRLRESEDIIIPFNEKPVEGQVYSIYINCLNLLDVPHYHHFNPYAIHGVLITSDHRPVPPVEPKGDCGENPMQVHCKDYSLSDFPAMGYDPVVALKEYDLFKRMKINEQIDYLYHQNIDSSLQDLNDFLALSLFSQQMALVNCEKFNSFTNCRDFKADNVKVILARIQLKYPNAYDKKDDGDGTANVFKMAYAKMLFFLSQNKDSMKPEQARQFIELIAGHLEKIETIKGGFRKEIDRTVLLRLYAGILNNICDLLHYEEIEVKDSVVSNKETGLITYDMNTLVKDRLEGLLKIIGQGGVVMPSFASQIIDIPQAKESDDLLKIILEDIDQSSIELPVSALNKKSVSRLLIIVYSTYPLLSYTNKNTNHKVISIIAYDKEGKEVEVKTLAKPVKIVFGNVNNPKDNQNMKVCYYRDKNQTFGKTGLTTITKDNSEVLLACSTNHFTDFFASQYNYKGKVDYFWLFICMIILGGLIVLGLAIFLIVFFCKRQEDGIESISPDPLIN